MASKSAQHEPEKAEVIEELLDHCDTTLDRVKVLYEQFFLGIQKQPPTHIHTDVERKLRELQQMQIRNTALRYRFATIQQKFGSYNNYWRRTLRQIESGTYHRNLAKIGRQAIQTGEDIPDEILAAMPKRMREQVKRDREAALAIKRRRDGTQQDGEFLEELDTPATPKKTSTGAHVLDDGDGEFDLDAYFRAVTNDDQPDETKPGIPTFPTEAPRAPAPPPRAAPPARAVAQTPRVAAPQPAEFEGELPTEADFDPPTERPVPIVNRPAPITNSPVQHPSAAIRAAVGMRTPPAGMPVAPRVAPPGVPGHASGGFPAPSPGQASGGFPPIATQPGHASGKHPGQTGMLPAVPAPPGHAQQRPIAPSQVVRPLPVMPGASTTRVPVAVETLSGPFPREQPAPQAPARPTGQNPAARTAPGMGPQRPAGQPPHTPPVRPGTPPVAPPAPRPGPPPPPAGARPAPINPARIRTEPGVAAPARVGPPPGMTDADVNALYAKYVKAKEAVGEKAGPGSYGKLLQTINAQAPKIMEQYKARGVDFQVVVKDNQVVIRAKPKP